MTGPTAEAPLVLVSSTVFPRPSPDPAVVRTVYSPEMRLKQTRQTVESLRTLGYTDILVCDNSGTQHQDVLERELTGASVVTFDHFQYDNKGISENLLLLSALDLVPDDRALIKISGRYVLDRKVPYDFDRYDIAARVYRHGGPFTRIRQMLVTRCYAVRNREVYQRFLLGVLDEVYAYSNRILGLRSLKRWIVNQFLSRTDGYSYFNPRILSVEAASMRAIRNQGLRLQCLDQLGLKGQIGSVESVLIED